jgi:hypothetical protein
MALIMDWAMQDFDDRNEVFPMHFTCLGWESVAVKVTANPYILSAHPLEQYLLLATLNAHCCCCGNLVS